MTSGQFVAKFLTNEVGFCRCLVDYEVTRSINITILVTNSYNSHPDASLMAAREETRCAVGETSPSSSTDAQGIVKLRRPLADLANEHQYTNLSGIPISSGYYQPWRLALSPRYCQLEAKSPVF
jgi:hypothetical protein